MKSLSLSSVTFVILLLSPVVGHAQQLPHKNPSLPVEKRMKDLLGRMSLEEKVAQMQSTWQTRGFAVPESEYFITNTGNRPGDEIKQ